MDVFFQQVVNGLAVGSGYVLIALGVTLVFGLTQLINFAHGQFVVIAALVAAGLVNGGMTYWLAAPIAVVVTAVVSLALERLVFRPTTGVPMNGFIISLGIIAASQGILTQLYGPEPQSIAPPISGVTQVGDVLIANSRLLMILVTAVLVAAVFAFLDRSSAGRRVRAATADPYAASLSGINVQRIITGMFVLGAAIAAVAGVLMIGVFVLSPFSGLSLVIKGFITAVVGGLGNVRGAAIAGIILGLVETMGGAYISPQWQDGFGYIFLVLVLSLRPGGLLKGTA